MADFFSTLSKVVSVLMSLLIAFFTSITNIGGGSSTTTTTTQKESTSVTSTVTTTKSSGTTTPTTSDKRGTFTFVSYGWGHGAGMSQQGAIAMAKSGYGYVSILTHYYTGTSVYKDASTPKTITYGDKKVDLVEFLCRTTKQEIGDDSPKEAIKAQAAAIYTFAKYYSFKVKTSQIATDSKFNYKGTNLYNYVLEYLGMTSATDTPKATYVSADKGKTAILAVFTDNVAGKTTKAGDVWGGDYPYLMPVESYEEPTVQVKTFTATEIEDLIYSYNANINLDSDPAKWFTNIKHDGSLTSDIGYISSITVGNKTMKGYTFRANVMNNKIRSHCFTVTYTPAK